jgi:hypothetical protein
MTRQVIITVKKDRSNKRYGYNLSHNQHHGFKGIISNTWGWYKYKKDAVKAAEELTRCWNQPINN